MARSLVTEAKAFPCPSCGVDVGEECWPREDGDAPWVHKHRSNIVEFNERMNGYELVLI